MIQEENNMKEQLLGVLEEIRPDLDWEAEIGRASCRERV